MSKQAQLSYNADYVDPSMEGFLNVPVLTNFFSGLITKLNTFFGNELIPVGVNSFTLDKSIRLLKNLNKSDLTHFMVYAPEYIDKNFPAFLSDLTEVMNELVNVDKQILIPLEQWAGNVITDPEYINKIWTAIPTKNEGISKHTEKLHKHFNESAGDGVAQRPIFTLYNSIEGIQQVSDLLKPLVDQSMKLLDGKLLKRANNISTLLMRISREEKYAKELRELPVEKIKPIVDLTRQAALELELLSICMFQIKVASYAHNENLKKISEQLK